MINKEIIYVPAGIRYISEWPGFSLPNYPVIIDKKLTGCGFTEWVLRGNFNAVLISPRRVLLKNKEKQHNQGVLPGFESVYYAKCSEDKDLPVDKDSKSNSIGSSKDNKPFDINQYYKDLEDAISNFILHRKPIKILVTYDSFRKVKEVLQKRGILNSFYCVVDEFQSIFQDGNFKAGTELEFVYALQGIQRLCYVSATPMIEESLNKLDEFKDLPYWVLDWEKEDSNRTYNPTIIPNSCRNINEIAKRYINDLFAGKYLIKTLTDSFGQPIKIVEAKELVFYVNSVKNIASIIKQNNLTIDQVNVICADTKENREKIRKAFKSVYENLGRKGCPKGSDVIGEVPVPDENTGIVNNKPITFCTKTVYLGADFYSDCARTIVLSDASIDSLSVDIRLDLPQILGRQRLDENPWKFYAEFWFISGTGAGEISQEQFDEIVKEKTRKTESFLATYEASPTSATKHDLAVVYKDRAMSKNYKEDYLGVNTHAGGDLIPQINKIVIVAEERAYKIQQIDYRSQISVFNTLKNTFKSSREDIDTAQYISDEINSLSSFIYKMKRCCDLVQSGTKVLLIPEPFRSYILTLGIDFINSVGGQKSKLDKALQQTNSSEKIYTKEEIAERIQSEFKIGQRISKSDIKVILSALYEEVGIPFKAKAVDIENWFEVSNCRILNNNTGKRDPGFEIISKK